MTLPSWADLVAYHSSNESHRPSLTQNPLYEPFANRRYNYARSHDVSSFRLVFSKNVVNTPRNKTLFRAGRFLWCRNLNYEGLDQLGFRQVSFTIGKGKKRFIVSERDVLCLPAKCFVNNSRFLRDNHAAYFAFSTVFSYMPALSMMARHLRQSAEEFCATLRSDSPWKPGALVAPRLGYFCPNAQACRRQSSQPEGETDQHPYGIILSRSDQDSNYYGREFYRVRFGQTTYEKVTPIQMEIINEI